MKLMRSQTRSRGFTLMELLIVVAIIAAVAALVVPFGKSMRAKSRQVACLNNLKEIGVGIESYLQDHSDTMPDIAAGRKTKEEDVLVLETALADYIENPEIYHCPEDQEIFQETGSSYIWNSTQSGKNKHRLEFFTITDDPGRVPLVTDKQKWHPGESGVNVLYADYSASREVNFSVSP